MPFIVASLVSFCGQIFLGLRGHFCDGEIRREFCDKGGIHRQKNTIQFCMVILYTVLIVEESFVLYERCVL